MRSTHDLTVGLVVLALGLVLVGCAASASEMAIAWRAEGPPTIDGDLSEWGKEDAVFIGDASQLTRNPEYWDDPYDSSGVFYLMWDEENLYIAGEIRDDTPFVTFMAYGLDGNDGMAVYISTNPENKPGRLIYDSSDFRLLFGLDNYEFGTGIDRSNVLIKKGIDTAGTGGNEQAIRGCEIAILQTELGFDLEIKIPFSSISNNQIPVLLPEQGMEVCFNLELYDLDQACPGAKESGLAWKPGNPHLSPKGWGVLRFQER